MGRKGACPSCRATLRLVAPDGVAGPHDFQAALTVIAGPRHQGEVYLLGGVSPIALGKLSELPIILPGQKVSRRHARLIRQPDAWAIEDMRSTNGTFVEDQQISAPRPLRDGEFLRIGEYEFKYILIHALSRVEIVEREAAVSLQPSPERHGVSGRYGADGRDVDADADTLLPSTESIEETDGLYGLAAVEFDQPAVEVGTEDDERAANEDVVDGDGPTCPSCGKQLPTGGVICIDCGINVITGRALVTTQETNLDAIYVTAERIIWGVSWLAWWCFIPVPIASEAFGTARPYAIRAIAILTVLISFWFLWAYDEIEGEGPGHLMLWAGETWSSEELAGFLVEEGLPPDWAHEEAEDYVAYLEEQGGFRGYQLITHAFLHGGLFHLAGNLVFLLVFGSRINALVGNLLTVPIYIILAVGAAMFHIASAGDDLMYPMVGASGATMGLAGMYLVLMPTPRVHLAVWFRWLFYLNIRMFSVRGFWVVLFFIGLDVIYIALKWEDNVAHWAHLGGFLVGVAIAAGLLMTRLVNARGGDIFTAILGKHAWGLIGKPHAAGRNVASAE